MSVIADLFTAVVQGVSMVAMLFEETLSPVATFFPTFQLDSRVVIPHAGLFRYVNVQV